MAQLAELLAQPSLADMRISKWLVFAIALAVVAGIGLWRARRAKLSLRQGVLLVALCAMAGGLGAHVGALIFDLGELLSNPWVALRPFSTGLSSLGAYLGGLVALVVGARYLGVSSGRWADAMAPGLCLGAATARLSCLVHGCDFGYPAAVPWAVRYDAGTPAFRYLVERGLVDPLRTTGLPMHPMPLYEAAPLAVVGVLLLLAPGLFGSRTWQAATGAGLCYCLIRFASESFRADAPLLSIHLSTIQLALIGGAGVFGVAWWLADSRWRPSWQTARA